MYMLVSCQLSGGSVWTRRRGAESKHTFITGHLGLDQVADLAAR